MANGSPSNTIPLGSAVLRAMGDIKGAAKALGTESKAAKADAREANKELKAAQKEAKKATDAIERLKRKGGIVSKEQQDEQKRLLEEVERRSVVAFDRQKKALATEAESQAAKQQLQVQRDQMRNMNAFEKRVQARLLGVQDSLQAVSRSLQGSGNVTLQKLGKQVGTAAGRITPDATAGIVRLGGLAFPGAGLAVRTRLTRRSLLVKVPSFSLQAAAGRTTWANRVMI